MATALASTRAGDRSVCICDMRCEIVITKSAHTQRVRASDIAGYPTLPEVDDDPHHPPQSTPPHRHIGPESRRTGGVSGGLGRFTHLLPRPGSFGQELLGNRHGSCRLTCLGWKTFW